MAQFEKTEFEKLEIAKIINWTFEDFMKFGKTELDTIQKLVVTNVMQANLLKEELVLSENKAMTKKLDKILDLYFDTEFSIYDSTVSKVFEWGLIAGRMKPFSSNFEAIKKQFLQ